MKTISRIALVSALLSATSLGGGTATAAQVFVTDVIVQGSLCVGFDCVNGESFGFDTLRLKENNLRIHFQDTSSSASFPTRDWRIAANDTSNGGAEYLAIQDVDSGQTPFRVDGATPTDTLRLTSSGRVGIGTGNPSVLVHAVDGNTPTLRLDQDGSAGFQPQVWDIAGNESNFFIRDVTNSSALPFRIQPGADSNMMYLASNGNIGLGTTSPQDRIHIRDTSGAYFGLRFEDTTNSSNWLVNLNPVNDRFVITKGGTGNAEFAIEPNGDVEIFGSVITGGGTCGGGCDLIFDESYDLPSIGEHAELMWSQGYLPNVGPTIEGERINLSDKVGRMLNELETAHIYIDQLNARIEALEAAQGTHQEASLR